MNIFWSEIEQEVRRAGVNVWRTESKLLIKCMSAKMDTKPLEIKTLSDILKKWIQKKAAEFAK